MKLFRFLHLSLFFLFTYGGLQAQDVHVTQFGAVPLSINPAQAGLYEGSYRVGGLYRSQWLSGLSGTYRTPFIFADIPISGLRKTDWIGIGLNIHQDAAGSNTIKRNLIGINGAYHLGLDKKFTSVISFGVQASFNQINIDRNGLRFQDAIVGGGTSVDQSALSGRNKGYTDINLGVNYRGMPNKTTTYNVGLSVEHLLSPKTNLIEKNEELSKIPRRFNLYSSVDLILNKNRTLSAHPGLIVRAQSGDIEAMLQGVMGFKLDPKSPLTLRGGLGYRVGDALQFLAGADWGDWRVGVAYDFTASKVRSDTRVQDGFELAVTYVGRIYKTVKPPPVILCPRY